MMIKTLYPTLLGVLALLLFGLNTLWWGSLLLLVVVFKLIIPHAGIKQYISRLLILIAMIWIEGNSAIIRMTRKIEWDVQGVEPLDFGKSYLVVSNHLSWADIFVLQHVFKRRIPFLKFFLKQELIWVPILGAAWWALDFPFLKRYSRSFLEKHPELRGKDMETTRRHCQKFKSQPVSVMNFLEGTRFDYRKHEKQKSPYRYLLSPRAGGVALIFSCMGDYLSNVVDVTIVYPEKKLPVHFWDLLAGRIRRIVVRVEVLPIPEKVVGMDYEADTVYRERIQQWVNRLWRAKDQRIDRIMAQGKKGRSDGSS